MKTILLITVVILIGLMGCKKEKDTSNDRASSDTTSSYTFCSKTFRIYRNHMNGSIYIVLELAEGQRAEPGDEINGDEHDLAARIDYRITNNNAACSINDGTTETEGIADSESCEINYENGNFYFTNGRLFYLADDGDYYRELIVDKDDCSEISE